MSKSTNAKNARESFGDSREDMPIPCCRVQSQCGYCRSASQLLRHTAHFRSTLVAYVVDAMPTPPTWVRHGPLGPDTWGTDRSRTNCHTTLLSVHKDGNRSAESWGSLNHPQTESATVSTILSIWREGGNWDFGCAVTEGRN